MNDSDKTIEKHQVLFSFYRNGQKIEGDIVGNALPVYTRFVINFRDAETVFVKACTSDQGQYQFVWEMEGLHRHADLFVPINELILKYYTVADADEAGVQNSN